MEYCKINDTTLEEVYFVPLTKMESIIPNNITVIGKNAFAGLSRLTEIIIPPSVQIIKSGAFHDCKGLKKIIIPETVQLVENGAFANCTALQEVTFSHKTIFEELCFSGCCSLKFINDGAVTARTFYYPKHNQFAISIKQDDLSTKEYTIYKGRFADDYFPNGEPDYETPVVYYAEIHKNGHEYIWYDTELKMAILGAQYQASGKSPAEFFKKEWTLDSTMTANEFSLLTGICYEGIGIWLRVGDCDRDTPWPLTTVLGFLQRDLPVVHKRLVKALEHQHDPVPTDFFINGIVRNQLIK